MRAHMAEPFPESIEKGEDCGGVDPVMIDADIYGWASRADSLSPDEKARVVQAADELERALAAFPVEARPYYARILQIAHLALTR